MNPPPDTPDPLLKCLAEDAAELPGMAAGEALRFRARRGLHRRRLAEGVVIAIFCVCFWRSLPLLRTTGTRAVSPPMLTRQLPAPSAARPAEFVRVQSAQAAMAEPTPAPPGASQEQKDLLAAARSLPLVLVMDSSGRLARIHVVECLAPSPLELGRQGVK